MKKIIDLNSDVGESFGNYKLGLDEEVLKYVSSVNVACGWHAGDAITMEKTVNNGFENNLGIGAHPGFPDLLGFGRRKIDITFQEARNYVIYQIGALKAFCKAKNCELQHVKLHGAFYNMVASNYELAKEVSKGIYDVDKNLIFLGLSGSMMIKAAEEVGLKVANEVFADRAYNSDGTLVSRKLPGSVIKDKNLAIDRVKKMILQGKVTTIDGKEIDIKADSICVHGDNPEAVSFVKLIREKLQQEGILIKPLREFI